MIRPSIYASDAKWEKVIARAKSHKMTTSAFVRACIRAEDGEELEDGHLSRKQQRHLYKIVCEIREGQRALNNLPNAIWHYPDIGNLNIANLRVEKEFHLGLRGVIEALYLMEQAKNVMLQGLYRKKGGDENEQ